MIIDTNFFSCLTCDAPEAWQIALSEPASKYIDAKFSIILAFVFFLGVLLLPLYLAGVYPKTFGTPFFDFLGRYSSKDVFELLVYKGVAFRSSAKNLPAVQKRTFWSSTLKNTKKWDPQKARIKIYNAIFFILLIVSVHYSLLFITCYLGIGYCYYLVSCWTRTDSNNKSHFSFFTKIKDNINFYFDVLQFYITEYKIILLIIFVFFSLYRHNYVLTVYFIVLLSLSYSKNFGLPQFFLDKITALKQDFETLKVHKKTDFKLVTDCLTVTWITLLVTFLLGPFVKSAGISEVIYFINGVLWCFVLEAALLVNLIIEIYIILYANTPVMEKLALLCVRCTASIIAAAGFHQAATESGYVEPNEVSNRVRTNVSNKPAIDTAADAHIDTEFRRRGVPEEKYTTPRESQYGEPMNYVDVEKASRLLEEDPLLKKRIIQTGSKGAKSALGLSKSKFFSGWWTDK